MYVPLQSSKSKLYLYCVWKYLLQRAPHIVLDLQNSTGDAHRSLQSHYPLIIFNDKSIKWS